ncbi:AraC family transcriptional regulator [Erysipelothrix urinaevulpis]|uniref:AraC family transcriptional regulator n=1 Tax=Erysipelothrix urinaevulpis TaxID=2683717 RepID=UPI001358E9EC|nr:AraC family transcriptional regulator [Erysipelothrix urinaevulpis]
MKKLPSNARLRYIENSIYDDDWHSTLHSHPFTEFFYVLSGKGKFKFDDKIVDVIEDDLVIINPNLNHTEISDANNPLQYIVLGLEGLQFFTSEDNDIGYSILNFYDYKHDILFYLKALLLEVENEDNLYQNIMVKNLLNILIINIIRRTDFELFVYEDVDNVNKDSVFIKNYLDKHFREEITLDDLAQITYLNKFYLSHIFKEHTGYGPIQYILEKRMSEAKKLLMTTDLVISQISGILGFSNPAYFSQYFKKKTEMSPSAYRKKYKNTKEIPDETL